MDRGITLFEISYTMAKKVTRHIGLVFLIHCCNIYGNSEEFLTLLGYTLPKQKTSWARSTIQPMVILSVPLKSYMAKVAPKIKKEFLRTFNFWIITEPFIGKRNWFLAVRYYCPTLRNSIQPKNSYTRVLKKTNMFPSPT